MSQEDSPAMKRRTSSRDTQGPDDVPSDAFEGKKFAVTGVFEVTSRDEVE